MSSFMFGRLRVLVVGGKVVAVSRGESAWVTADGRSTVAQLVDARRIQIKGGRRGHCRGTQIVAECRHAFVVGGRPTNSTPRRASRSGCGTRRPMRH